MAYSISQMSSAVREGSTISANVVAIFLPAISIMFHLRPGFIDNRAKPLIHQPSQRSKSNQKGRRTSRSDFHSRRISYDKRPMFPVWKSSITWRISWDVFMTNGPCPTMGSSIGSPQSSKAVASFTHLLRILLPARSNKAAPFQTYRRAGRNRGRELLMDDTQRLPKIRGFQIGRPRKKGAS